jgi:hypothetical protein
MRLIEWPDIKVAAGIFLPYSICGTVPVSSLQVNTSCCPEAKFKVPGWGENVDSGIGLTRRVWHRVPMVNALESIDSILRL